MLSSCSAGRRSPRKLSMRAYAAAFAWPRSTWAGVSGSSSTARLAATCTYAQRCFRRLQMMPARSTCRRRLSRRSFNSRKVVDRWSRDETNAAEGKRLADRAAQIRQRVGRLASADTADHVRGIEGDAARIYFRALGQAVASSGLEFSARTQGHHEIPSTPCHDSATACWCPSASAQLKALVWTSKWDSSIAPRVGRPSLALDLSEELRALTDRFVVSLIRRRQVAADSFVHMPGGGVYLSDGGRTRLIKEWEAHKEAETHHQVLGRSIGRWALPSVQATLLARHLRGDLPAYPPVYVALKRWMSSSPTTSPTRTGLGRRGSNASPMSAGNTASGCNSRSPSASSSLRGRLA